MADSKPSTAKEKLKHALESGVQLTANAVDITLTTANAAVEVAGKTAKLATEVSGQAIGVTSDISKQGLTTAGVLGIDTLKAAEKIGTAATAATGELSSQGLQATTKIGTAALQTASNVTENTLKAATKVTNAATSAAADIASTTFETTASVATETEKQIGENLNKAVALAGNTSRRVLVGLDNFGAIVANAGRNKAASTIQNQDARFAAIQASEQSTLKSEFIKVFMDVEKQMIATVRIMQGVQKTALAGQMNIYKRAKCGFFRRITGTCDVTAIRKDLMKTDFFLDELTAKIKLAGGQARVNIEKLTDVNLETYKTIVDTFTSESATAVDKFVSDYKVLFDDYTKRTKEALGISGGKRKKTYRKKKRSIRASRRRPSVRG